MLFTPFMIYLIRSHDQMAELISSIFAKLRNIIAFQNMKKGKAQQQQLPQPSKLRTILNEKYSTQLFVLIAYLKHAPKSVQNILAPYAVFLADQQLNEDSTFKNLLENLKRTKPLLAVEMTETQRQLLKKIMEMLGLQKFYKLMCQNEKCEKSFTNFVNFWENQTSKASSRSYSSTIKLNLIRPQYYSNQLLAKYEGKVGIGQRFSEQDSIESIFYKEPRFIDKLGQLYHLRKNDKNLGNIALFQYDGNFIVGKRSYAVAKDHYFQIWQKAQQCYIYPFPENPLLFQSRTQQFAKLLAGKHIGQVEQVFEKEDQQIQQNQQKKQQQLDIKRLFRQMRSKKSQQVSQRAEQGDRVEQEEQRKEGQREDQLKKKKSQSQHQEIQRQSSLSAQLPEKQIQIKSSFESHQQKKEKQPSQLLKSQQRKSEKSKQDQPQQEVQQNRPAQKAQQRAQKSKKEKLQSSKQFPSSEQWRNVQSSVTSESEISQKPQRNELKNQYQVKPPKSLTLKRSFKYLGHLSKVTCASFSQDQFYIITGSTDRTVKLWCLRLKIVLATFHSHFKTVWDVHFNPSGLYFLSGGADGMMILWKTDNPKPQRIFSHKSDVYKVHFAKNPSYAISGGEQGILRIWHITKAEIVKVINTENPIINFSLGHSEAYILLIQTDGRVTLHNINKGVLVTSFYFYYKRLGESNEKRQIIHDAAFSQDEKNIVCVTTKHILLYSVQTLQISNKNLNDVILMDNLLKPSQRREKQVTPYLVLMSYGDLRFTFCRYRHRGMILIGGTRYQPL